ncbi:hypothetical protein F511_40590 [Dorcoceras hygrometricum]|uniref:Uncharacterized protein n=1 Tax=Dorcoceras hygrometricum TaxID=472368 RepID=A0A2Z7CZW1_9LAMI|nr:hypothetical protein F511_40590 [Dorcoceras hygrometricum]
MHETRTTAVGYNQGREPKNSMHSSTGFAIEYVATPDAEICPFDTKMLTLKSLLTLLCPLSINASVQCCAFLDFLFGFLTTMHSLFAHTSSVSLRLIYKASCAIISVGHKDVSVVKASKKF